MLEFIYRSSAAQQDLSYTSAKNATNNYSVKFYKEEENDKLLT